MSRRLRAMVLLAGVAAFIYAGTAGAATLKISPLSYRVDLASGEKKKGYVDITNPGPVTEKVQLTVQAFRQIDDNGTLEFYDNAALSAGLLLDYQQVEIGPHEVLHLAFIADGTKLPGGDVFGAILAATLPGEESAANQAAQVGALVIISNGQPPPAHSQGGATKRSYRSGRRKRVSQVCAAQYHAAWCGERFFAACHNYHVAVH